MKRGKVSESGFTCGTRLLHARGDSDTSVTCTSKDYARSSNSERVFQFGKACKMMWPVLRERFCPPADPNFRWSHINTEMEFHIGEREIDEFVIVEMHHFKTVTTQ